MDQEKIALSIVLFSLSLVLIKFYRTYLAAGLAAWLLKRGQVKWAMRMKSQVISKSGCTGCKT